jgi:hypothetical protein
VSDVWRPWDPEGSRPEEPGKEGGGPDPEPIVRTVRLAFLLAGVLVALLVNAGLHPLWTGSGRADRSLLVTGVVGLLVLGILGAATWALRPAHLLVVGKRALDHPDPRQRRPRAERARAMGFRGLAMGWATQAMLLGLVPAFAGLVLEQLHGLPWELLTFAGASLLAGFVYQRQVTDAVRRAVDDPELRASYGAR